MTSVHAIVRSAEDAQFADFLGEVTSIGQKTLTANGPNCRLGDVCKIGRLATAMLAEVVAIDGTRISLVPYGELADVRLGEVVTISPRHNGLPIGDAFIGRAVDAFGQAIDGGPPILASSTAHRRCENVMAKTIVAERVETGVRAIDSLVPLAQGQRIGVFAASGVGKTTLVEQLSRQISCDKAVICLVGERGREVERIWKLHAHAHGNAPVTIVAATSEESPSLRVRAVKQAISLSEAWRERGEHVVLFIDSITRLAAALRDIGLAAGEPPALRSYTPNVFSTLPEFVERCGAVKGKGAITAIITVLSETDDVDDPIVETMKSLLDGHIVLSRKLAERGHYPAIDVRASVSRVADQILGEASLQSAQKLKKLVATYEDARAMIESGLYQEGANAEIDRAIALMPGIQQFLEQAGPKASLLDQTDADLENCLAGSIGP